MNIGKPYDQWDVADHAAAATAIAEFSRSPGFEKLMAEYGSDYARAKGFKDGPIRDKDDANFYLGQFVVLERILSVGLGVVEEEEVLALNAVHTQ